MKTPPFAVAAFYRFVALPDYAEKKTPLLACCRAQDVKGTILLAEEGINGTIAGPPEGVAAVLAWLRADPRLAALEHKTSQASSPPFYRMKVRLKQEIVTFRVPGTDPRRRVGTYVAPADWNDLIARPDVLVVDTRNDFEVAMGSFEGAQDPQTASFHEFPDFVARRMDPSQHRAVALFCTGGIRCEKATSYLLDQGFEAVYHLQGGILKYLETVPPAESRWRGECFVFDNRVALRHQLEEGTYTLCHGCQAPVSAADRAAPDYEEGVCCPRCAATISDDKRRRARERQQQVERARRRGQAHLGQSFD